MHINFSKKQSTGKFLKQKTGSFLSKAKLSNCSNFLTTKRAELQIKGKFLVDFS